MKIEEQKLLRHACHELRSVRATLQAGFRHIQNPNADTQKAKSLCEQGLSRLDKMLEELEDQIVDSSKALEIRP